MSNCQLYQHQLQFHLFSGSLLFPPTCTIKSQHPFLDCPKGFTTSEVFGRGDLSQKMMPKAGTVFRISRWIFTMRPAQLATNSWSIIVDDSFLPTNGGWLPTLMTLAYKPLATLLLLMSPFSGKHNFLKAPFSMYLLGSVDDWQVTHWLAQPWVVLSRWGLHVIDKNYTLIARQKYICKPKNICWYCKTDYLLQQQQNNTVYIQYINEGEF